MIPLPPYVFILGPKGSGRQALANLLWEDNQMRVISSFDEPIREATLAIFYPEQLHTGVDLRNPVILGANAPYTASPLADFMSGLKQGLRNLSPHLMGDLLKKRLGYGPIHYANYLLLDADGPDDVKPFVSSFGADACLLILVERQGFPLATTSAVWRGSFLRTAVVKNPEGDPHAMLSHLRNILANSEGQVL